MTTVLITGARGLLGRIYTQAFIDAGYNVIATDLPEHDVTNPEHWQGYDCDVLINNAGVTNNTGMPAGVFGGWSDILNVNLTGTVIGCQFIGQKMVKRKYGCIINIGSLYGLVSPHHDIYAGTGIKQPLAYSVSKAGVMQVTRYLACLWGKYGVRVNTLTPGGVYNGQSEAFVSRFEKHNPMGRMAQPNELASAALFLASASYVNGHNLVVDGGWAAW
jgi:NAD(P)-dependent dehydrogenase (short-subunit alcohol dehydrogenase family)